MERKDISRILIEDNDGNVYAYGVWNGLGCESCDIKDCEVIREMCRGLRHFGDGCFKLRKSLSVEVNWDEIKKSD